MHLGPIMNRYLSHYCDDEKLILFSFVSSAHFMLSNENNALVGGWGSGEPGAYLAE